MNWPPCNAAFHRLGGCKPEALAGFADSGGQARSVSVGPVALARTACALVWSAHGSPGAQTRPRPCKISQMSKAVFAPTIVALANKIICAAARSAHSSAF